LSTIEIKKSGLGAHHSHLPDDNINKSRASPTSIVLKTKVGPLPPTRFQAYQPRLCSFLFQHKQMYEHTTARFKNVSRTNTSGI